MTEGDYLYLAPTLWNVIMFLCIALAAAIGVVALIRRGPR